MLLEIQKFIKRVEDIELANELLHIKLGINVKKEKLILSTNKSEYVYLYNYTDKSPKPHPIADECTGLILSKSGDVISRGPNRIFEVTDMAHKIKWTQAVAEEYIPGVRITASAKTKGKTGVEMEALTAVSVAALTIYDMAKAAEKTMKIQNIRLVEKHGGQSGDVANE